MTRRASPAAKAAAAAVLLVLAGALLGIAIDRVWLLPRSAEPLPLTAEALAASLDLAPADRARLHALLDSIQPDVLAAAAHGTDSLRSTARRAHDRIEAALPPHTRPAFRAWLNQHHRQLEERLHTPHRRPHP